MQIINIRSQTIVSSNAKYANTFFQRLKGLMFKSMMDKDEALILCPCKMIHTFGMRFNIDVIFLSKDKKILFSIERFTPWSISSFVKGTLMVIELPSGTIEEKQIKIGDCLSIV